MNTPEHQLSRGLFTARELKEKHFGRCILTVIFGQMSYEPIFLQLRRFIVV